MRAGHALFYQGSGRHAGNIPAAEMDLSRRRTDCSGNQAEQRCLARAIGPNETANLVFRNIKAYVLQRCHAPKVLGQRLDFQNLHVFS
jgi:hypothetical protein